MLKFKAKLKRDKEFEKKWLAHCEMMGRPDMIAAFKGAYKYKNYKIINDCGPTMEDNFITISSGGAKFKDKDVDFILNGLCSNPANAKKYFKNTFGFPILIVEEY